MSRIEPIQVVLDTLAKHGIPVNKSGNGYMCCCPAHDDTNPSLSIGTGDDGRGLLNCFAGCAAEKICRSLGLTVADLFARDTDTRECARRPARATRQNVYAGPVFGSMGKAVEQLAFKLGKPVQVWEYHDEQGACVGAVVRFETETGKSFRPVSVDPDRDGWVCAAMRSPKPLYGLTQLLKLPAGASVYVCEGEKAADAASSIGLVATTSAGENYARQVVKQAVEIGAKSVRIVRLVDLWNALPKGGDIADLIEHGEDRDALGQEIESLVLVAKPEAAPNEQGHGMPVLIKLDEVEPEHIQWLWPGRIAQGKLTMLAGDPGLGKSFVTLDIAARLSRGLAWPDDPGTQMAPGGVVLLSAEDGIADTIRPRLDAAGADVSKIVALESVCAVNAKGVRSGRTFDLSSDIGALDIAITSVAGCNRSSSIRSLRIWAQPIRTRTARSVGCWHRPLHWPRNTMWQS